MNIDDSARPLFGRRHLLRAAAWSVPVVAVAVAIPAAAASGETDAVTPQDIHIEALCGSATGDPTVTRFGFTVTNRSVTGTATAAIRFRADSREDAEAFVIGAISNRWAEAVNEPVQGYTYDSVWQPTSIDTGVSTWGRMGNATFVLLPGQSVTLWKETRMPHGTGTVSARLLTLNGTATVDPPRVSWSANQLGCIAP